MVANDLKVVEGGEEDLRPECIKSTLCGVDNCFTLTPEGREVHNGDIESTYCCLARFPPEGIVEMHMIKSHSALGVAPVL